MFVTRLLVGMRLIAPLHPRAKPDKEICVDQAFIFMQNPFDCYFCREKGYVWIHGNGSLCVYRAGERYAISAYLQELQSQSMRAYLPPTKWQPQSMQAAPTPFTTS